VHSFPPPFRDSRLTEPWLSLEVGRATCQSILWSSSFAGARGLRPKTRRFPLAQAGEALAGMQTGHMTGRAVLIAAGCPLSVGLQLGPYRISGSSVSGRRHGAGLECVSQKCLGEFA